MKPLPLLIALLIAGLAISAALLGWRRTASSPLPITQTPAGAPQASSELTLKAVDSSEPSSTQPSTAPVATTESSTKSDQSGVVAESHQAYVERRMSELQDLSAENDAASLETILSELTNRDRQIRHAAIEASMQFGSRDAIPRLLEASAQTDDPAEKAELQQAADYLKLPSLTEVLAQQKNRQTPVQITIQPPRRNFPSKKQPAPTPQ